MKHYLNHLRIHSGWLRLLCNPDPLRLGAPSGATQDFPLPCREDCLRANLPEDLHTMLAGSAIPSTQSEPVPPAHWGARMGSSSVSPLQVSFPSAQPTAALPACLMQGPPDTCYTSDSVKSEIYVPTPDTWKVTMYVCVHMCMRKGAYLYCTCMCIHTHIFIHTYTDVYLFPGSAC